MIQDNFRPVAGTGQTLAIGVASVSSTAIPSGTFYVRLSSTGNCHVRVGTAPTAVSTDMLVKATDPPVCIRVQPGEIIAVIQDAASTGNLNIIGVTH